MKSCPPFVALSCAVTEGVGTQLQAHLRGCTECSSTLRRMRSLGDAARALPASRPDAETARELEKRILARAMQERPARRHRWAPRATAAIAAAAVIALVAWTLAPGHAPQSLRGVVAANAGARYQHLTLHAGQPGEVLAEVVQLDEGMVALEVEHLRHGERFLVATLDAEVEVRGTAFTVEAANGALQSVAVQRGAVEVRFGDEPPVMLFRGERWERSQQVREVAPRAAEQELPDRPDAPSPPKHDLLAAMPAHAEQSEGLLAPRLVARAEGAVAPASAPRVAGSSPAAGHPAEIVREHSQALTPAAEPFATQVTRAATSETTAPLPAPTAPPAEAAFAAAWEQLRAGDASDAAVGFARIAGMAAPPALAEDAAYWRIVALGRAEGPDAATPAMEEFLRRHPGSARAGEVHLMLGLRLLAAGDGAAADVHLHAAARDPLPAIRERAEEALRSR